MVHVLVVGSHTFGQYIEFNIAKVQQETTWFAPAQSRHAQDPVGSFASPSLISAKMMQGQHKAQQHNLQL